MANKFVALLVVCLVFVAAIEVSKATDEVFAECFKPCNEECKNGGNGQTFCEMKCDTDCFNKEFAARLHAKAP